MRMSKTMKCFFLMLFVLVGLTGCITKYTYQMELTHPLHNKDLHYENDSFSIAFTFEQKWIDVEIYNKMEDAIRINWDETSLGVKGKAYRLVHGQTSAAHINDVQPPTTIPPKTKLDDVLIPSDNIHGTYQYLFLYNIFPKEANNKKEKENILNFKDQRVVISLPLYVKNQYLSYYYDVYISDVIASKH